MKKLFFLLILIVTSTSQINAEMGPSYPSLPDPDHLALPNCPMQLVGVANGISFWRTSICPSTSTSGYGQTTNPMVVPGCNGNVCKFPITPLLPFSTEARTSSANYAPAATTVPDAIAECQARLAYLATLLASDEVEGRTRGRIQAWRGEILRVLNYLEKGGDSDAEKLKNYNDDFVPKDLNHDKHWSNSVIRLQFKTQLIDDEPQPNRPVKDAVKFVAKASGVSHALGPVLKVDVKKLQGGDKTVYFQTIVVTDGLHNFRIGLEVDPIGVTAHGDARFVDRHRHGHLIEATSGPNPRVRYLVSSHSNLEIKK